MNRGDSTSGKQITSLAEPFGGMELQWDSTTRSEMATREQLVAICERKRAYATYAEAREAGVRTMRRDLHGGMILPYQCEICRMYHNGHDHKVTVNYTTTPMPEISTGKKRPT